MGKQLISIFFLNAEIGKTNGCLVGQYFQIMWKAISGHNKSFFLSTPVFSSFYLYFSFAVFNRLWNIQNSRSITNTFKFLTSESVLAAYCWYLYYLWKPKKLWRKDLMLTFLETTDTLPWSSLLYCAAHNVILEFVLHFCFWTLLQGLYHEIACWVPFNPQSISCRTANLVLEINMTTLFAVDPPVFIVLAICS